MTKKNKNPKKFFGFTDGHREKGANSIKGVDYVKHGYPSERRTKRAIKKKIQDEEARTEMRDIKREKGF